jgi:hypothetical protein
MPSVAVMFLWWLIILNVIMWDMAPFLGYYIHGGITKFPWCFQQNKYIPMYIIFSAGISGHGVLNKYPTVWLGGVIPPQKHIENNIAEWYIKYQLGNKNTQQWKSPNRFTGGILLQRKTPGSDWCYLGSLIETILIVDTSHKGQS